MTVNTNICDSILHVCVRRARDHLNCERFSSDGSESKPFIGIFREHGFKKGSRKSKIKKGSGKFFSTRMTLTEQNSENKI